MSWTICIHATSAPDDYDQAAAISEAMESAAKRAGAADIFCEILEQDEGRAALRETRQCCEGVDHECCKHGCQARAGASREKEPDCG